MVIIGVKFYSVPSPNRGLTLRSGSQNFHIRVKIFALNFIWLYYQDPLMNFMFIWYDGRNRSNSAQSQPRGMNLRSRLQNFHIKIKMYNKSKKGFISLYSYIIKTF